jgi:hypothetical protein
MAAFRKTVASTGEIAFANGAEAIVLKFTDGGFTCWIADDERHAQELKALVGETIVILDDQEWPEYLTSRALH